MIQAGDALVLAILIYYFLLLININVFLACIIGYVLYKAVSSFNKDAKC